MLIREEVWCVYLSKLNILEETKNVGFIYICEKLKKALKIRDTKYFLSELAF